MSEESGSTALALIDVSMSLVPVKVFTREGTDDVLAKLKQHARAQAQNPEYDISTPVGRKNRASLAYKVSQSKVVLEKMGDELVEGWRKQTKAVTVEKTRIEKELAELRDEIRKPLTDWEDAEKLRAETHENNLRLMDSMDVFETYGPAGIPESAYIKSRIEALPRHYEREWEEFAPRAAITHERVRASLESKLTQSIKQEADAAELARLRAEEEQRVAAWHALHNEARDENIAFDAARKAKKDAEDRAEKDRAAAAAASAAREKALQDERDSEARRAKESEEKAERDRLQAIKDKKDAEDRAEKDRAAAAAASAAREKALQDERDAEARRAKESEEKAERDRLQAIKDKKDAEDAAAQRERDKIAKEKADEEKAAAAREADKKHKAKINNEALSAIKKAVEKTSDLTGSDPYQEIIKAIAKGEIPHVSIKY